LAPGQESGGVRPAGSFADRSGDSRALAVSRRLVGQGLPWWPAVLRATKHLSGTAFLRGGGLPSWQAVLLVAWPFVWRPASSFDRARPRRRAPPPHCWSRAGTRKLNVLEPSRVGIGSLRVDYPAPDMVWPPLPALGCSGMPSGRSTASVQRLSCAFAPRLLQCCARPIGRRGAGLKR